MRCGVPNRVRRIRRDRGWTQASLASAVGISRQAIIAIEKGGTPSLTTALRLRRVLDVATDTLFPTHASEAARMMKGEKT